MEVLMEFLTSNALDCGLFAASGWGLGAFLLWRYIKLVNLALRLEREKRNG